MIKLIILSVLFLFVLFLFRRKLRKAVWYIKDIFFLRAAVKDLSLIKVNHYEFLKRAFKIARGRSKYYRGLAFELVKEVRKTSPYRIQNYAEAEKLYREYFTLENHIPSFELLREKVKTEKEVWVRCFSRDIAVKGQRYSEYYINGGGSVGETFKLDKEEKSYGFISDPFVNDLGHCVSADNITQFKFATEQEIIAAKNKRNQIKEIEQMIVKKQEELSKLYTQKSKIK